MKLILKFYYKEKERTRLVISPARINEIGLYSDIYNVYTEEGNFSKKNIIGEIRQIWIEDPESEENSQI